MARGTISVLYVPFGAGGLQATQVAVPPLTGTDEPATQAAQPAERPRP